MQHQEAYHHYMQFLSVVHNNNKGKLKEPCVRDLALDYAKRFTTLAEAANEAPHRYYDLHIASTLHTLQNRPMGAGQTTGATDVREQVGHTTGVVNRATGVVITWKVLLWSLCWLKMSKPRKARKAGKTRKTSTSQVCVRDVGSPDRSSTLSTSISPSDLNPRKARRVKRHKGVSSTSTASTVTTGSTTTGSTTAGTTAASISKGGRKRLVTSATTTATASGTATTSASGTAEQPPSAEPGGPSIHPVTTGQPTYSTITRERRRANSTTHNSKQHSTNSYRWRTRYNARRSRRCDGTIVTTPAASEVTVL